ncbi:malate dehydrogenase (quinone) [Reinekea sp. G2M2-21]|uniref:malate dehydrogenase (quinone) n=1 Tax=Reinekea sp. G2M2-21 TaxID=2788942 RepID=UPI0018A9D8CE|nr:malate dehydrogenase (quinone) [Reinekea sp. G2M2-21]
MSVKSVDVLLVGGGVMSATLGVLLKQLDPSISMLMVEKNEKVALESSDGWNNAGTGHAAYCELNYTPMMPDGSIDTQKAVNINAAFEVSLQFWSYLVNKGFFPDPTHFINRTPHQSFVWGEKNVEFLRKRFAELSKLPMFSAMEYSEDPDVLREWMPLVMQGRDPQEKVAGTRVQHGADVDYGSITRDLIYNLSKETGFELLVSHEVKAFRKRPDQRWSVAVKDKIMGKTQYINAKFVFLGAGGGALPLLQASGVPEGLGYGGFPVSGQWLVCKKAEIVEQHSAKVYGKAPIGAPPMSVPHLDTRVIDGEKALLFGPFAGFTTKFLKQGSYLDLIKSVRPNNLFPMMRVGLRHTDLTRYLISEVMLSHEDRVESLRNFFPDAQLDDWHLAIAGQRVQIIKKDPKLGGKLEFGTEVITTQDGSLAALLGASPGASTAVDTMVGILEICFADRVGSEAWQTKLKEMIPSYGQSLKENPELLKEVRQYTLSSLKLNP